MEDVEGRFDCNEGVEGLLESSCYEGLFDFVVVVGFIMFFRV